MMMMPNFLIGFKFSTPPNFLIDCPEETITTEHVPDENEKKAHRLI